MKKRLITSALPYVNNEPHLGNIVGCVLSADVFARFCRLKGYQTLYVCGTDEYGTATETKALQENSTPQEICDKYYQIHKKIYQYFNIKFDIFGRTSTPNHTKTVQEIFHQIETKNGFIQQKTKQLFCNDCKRFLADRFIYGQCPKCPSKSARGDQCDSCGNLLTPTELILPTCGICSSKSIKPVKSNHLFLDLPFFQKQLTRWQNSTYKGWANNAIKITQSWMTQPKGLQPRALTRDLKWGVPVPKNGFRDKVFYVWFDAPIGYISITRSARDDWKSWWKNPQKVDLYQFMGKDNIPFHSIIFPATQMATEENWTKVNKIASVEYLNYEDTKFSKSRNIGIFGTDVINSTIPVDLWRFYLISVRPEKKDSFFSWHDFYNKINNDFIDNICNLVNRVTVYTQKNFNGKLTEPNYQNEIKNFIQQIKLILTKIDTAYEANQQKKALKNILELGRLGNRFFQEQEPWVKIKKDKNTVHKVITVLIYLIKDIAISLSPIMPETSERIAHILNFKDLNWTQLGNFSCLSKSINQPEILFQKLTLELIEELKIKFGKKNNDWQKINLQVGKIIEVKIHPTNPNLYVIQVNFNENKTRQIIIGLSKYYKLEELINKKIIGITNLIPTQFNKIISEGILLTAIKRKNLELLEPQENSRIGSFLQTYENPLNPNSNTISINDFKKINFEIKNNIFCINNLPLLANNLEIKTKNIINGSVR